MEAFATWLDHAAKNVATAHGAAISPPARVSDSEPIACDPHLFAVLENAAKSAGMTTLPLVSGAGHDAAWIARVVPAAMIFVPSRDGRSHAPDEWTDNDAIARRGRAVRGGPRARRGTRDDEDIDGWAAFWSRKTSRPPSSPAIGRLAMRTCPANLFINCADVDSTV